MRTNKRLYPIGWLLLASLTLPLSGCVATYQGQDLVQILTKLMTQSVAVFDLLISFCYIAGATFVVKGIYEFKVYGEQRTMMSQQTTIRTPLTHIGVGMALLYAPSMISIIGNSMIGQPNVILAYLDPAYTSYSGTWDQVELAVVTLLQICGLVSFIRGFFMLSHTQAGPNGGVGKGLTHVIAGVLLLNLQTVLKILANSL